MSEQQFPPAFEHLREFAFHAALRAWTTLGHFFVAQSILALAWTTIVGFNFPGKVLVLLAISIIGIVLGFQWCLLCTRMWHYHLEYVRELKQLWSQLDPQIHGAGTNGWNAVDKAIYEHWRKARLPWSIRALSGNQSTLFLAPLFVALVHFVMLTVIAWNIEVAGPYLTIAFGVVFAFCIAAIWKISKPVLEIEVF